MRARSLAGPLCLDKNTSVSSLYCVQVIKSGGAAVTAADTQMCLLLEFLLLLFRSLKEKHKKPLACCSSLSLKVLWLKSRTLGYIPLHNCSHCGIIKYLTNKSSPQAPVKAALQSVWLWQCLTCSQSCFPNLGILHSQSCQANTHLPLGTGHLRAGRSSRCPSKELCLKDDPGDHFPSLWL